MEHLKRKSAPSAHCACNEAPYCFSSCILDSVPLSDIDMEEVFHSEVKKRLKGNVSARSFSQLSGSHKRWCFYWYYAVNYFHLGGHDAEELPACLVAAVRLNYPDPVGKYTGFMTKEARVEKSLKEM